MIILNAGRRLHYLVGGTLVLAILIGLSSSVAMAGKAPARSTKPASQVDVMLAEAADQQTGPGLEDDSAFAPKFKTVVARAHAGQRSPFKVLACAWSGAGICGRAGRL